MIRRACRDDIPAIVSLLSRHHAERASDFPFVFDPVLASMDIANILAAQNYICLITNRCALIGMVHRPLFVPQRVAIEIFLRCERPSVRKPMVETFETWARGQGCERAALGSTHRFPAFGRLYAADGYVPSEMTFAKSL